MDIQQLCQVVENHKDTILRDKWFPTTKTALLPSTSTAEFYNFGTLPLGSVPIYIIQVYPHYTF